MTATCDGTGHVLLHPGDDFWSECPGCPDCCPADAELIRSLVEDGHEKMARSTYGDEAVDAVLDEHTFAMLLAFGAVE